MTMKNMVAIWMLWTLGVSLSHSVQAGQTPQYLLNSQNSQVPGPSLVILSGSQLLDRTTPQILPPTHRGQNDNLPVFTERRISAVMRKQPPKLLHSHTLSYERLRLKNRLWGNLTVGKSFTPDGTASDMNPVAESPEKLKEKSRGRAFLFSILLPGAGQYYVGHKHRARNFLISEILLWTTYAGFRTYGNWVKNDYQVYAATHAGANISGKDHGYFVDMGNYDNIYEHNEAQRNQRELEEVYPENSLYFWDWDSEASRQKFENLRLTSDTAYNRAELTIGAIIAHHLLSAIDAVWMTNKYNKKLRQSGLDLHIKFGSQTPHNNVLITLSRSF